MPAMTVTMSKFGPSGSLNVANITREHTMAVTAKMTNETVFDLKYIPYDTMDY